ncbi:MAG: hypothetical protein ABSE43_08285 [Steroidobacteraceae bacterium]
MKSKLAKIERLPGGKPYKYWFCVPWDAYSDSDYFVFDLRSKPAPGSGMDWTQSAGHFAISRRTGALRYFDLATEQVVDIPKIYYGFGDTNAVQSGNPAESGGSSR